MHRRGSVAMVLALLVGAGGAGWAKRRTSTYAIDVLDEDGRPVRGARVEGATTDRFGHVEIGARSGSIHFVHVAHEDFMPASIDLDREASADRRATVHLTRAVAEIRGFVIAPSGSRLANGWVGCERDGLRVASAAVQADGAFRLSLPDAEPCTLIASANGLASATLEGVMAGARGVIVHLTTGPTLEGRVLLASGEPAAGATVHAFPADRRPGHATLFATDAEGAFRITGLEAEPYLVTAELGELAVGSPVIRPFEPGLVLRLPAGGMLKGRVVDAATRRPIARFRIDDRDVAGGVYKIGPLNPGLHTMVVWAPGHAAQVARAVVEDGKTTHLDIALTPGGCARGGVVEEGTSTPIAGAHVAATGPGWSTVPSDVPAEADTGDDGAFEVCALFDHPQMLLVVAPGYIERFFPGVTPRPDAPLRIGLRVRGPGDAGAFEASGIGVRLDLGGSIAEVGAKTPAAEAGLRVGDRIVAVDGRAVDDETDAIDWVAGAEGTNVRLRVRRGDEVFECSILRRRFMGRR